jgi:ABC-type branched-subunit amino acid transport system substrate-binding protein
MKYLLLTTFAFLLLSSGCGNSTSSDDSTENISEPIGVILPLSGDGPIDTVAQEAILEVAVEDANAYFEDSSINLTVDTEIYDSGNMFTGIEEAVSYFTDNNIKLITSSGTSQNIIDALTAIHQFDGVLIHATSTAPSLALDDNIYRLIPNDSITSTKIAEKIWADGIEKAIILHREDTWGFELADGIKAAYELLGGEIDTTVAYPARLLPDCLPDALDSVDTSLDSVLLDTTPDKTGLVVLCFNEINDILKEASSTTNLLGVSWYGSDGIVMNDLMLEDTLAAANAALVNLYRPAISVSQSTKLDSIKSKVVEKIGYEPGAGNYLIYDAFFAAAIVKAKADTSSLDSLKQGLLDALGEDVYITGDILLDANGDRYDCSFDFYKVTQEGSGYFWTKAD